MSDGKLIRTILVSVVLVLSAFTETNGSVPSINTARPSEPGTLAQESKPADVRELTLAVPIERDLKGGESHSYRVMLNAGQYLHVVVEQKGIDVVVKLSGPDAQEIAEVDSPNGTQGPEPVSLIAEAAGEYRLEVQSFEKTAAPGKYEIEMKELRPGTAKDRDRIAAQRTFTEAEQLRGQGTAQSLQKAIEKYNEALPLFRKVEDREGEATTLNLIGVRYWELGDNQKALEYYSKALPLWRSLGNQKEEGQVLHNFGTAYWQSGDSQKALEYYSQALPLIRAAGDRTQEAITLNTTGLAYYELGQLREALDYFNQALVLLRLLENRRDEATTLISLGSAYFKLGELQKALEYFNQALPLRRATGDRRGEAATLNNIGVLYLRLGEPQKALEYHNQALPLRRETGDRYGEVSTLHNIGVVYKWLGEPQKALNYYNQALSLARATGDRRDEASTLQEIGVAYQSLGESQKALEYYNQSLLLRHDMGDKWAEALTLSHIGDNYIALGKPQEALNHLRQALSLQRAVGDQGDEAVTLQDIARAEQSLGQLSDARAHIEAALKIIESTRSTFVSQELRSSYLVSNQNSYEFYIDLLMRMHRDQPSVGNDAMAFAASERARARVLLEDLAETYAAIRQGVDASLLERERLSQQQLSAKAERLSRLLSSKHSEEQESAVKKELEALLTDYQDVQSQIRAKSPRYAALTQPQPLSLKGIQQMLDEDTLLLEYALGEEHSYLWAVTPSSIKSFELPKRASVEAEARRVYEALTARNKLVRFEKPEDRLARIRKADDEYSGASAVLSQILLGPVAGQLGRKRLLVVSEGALQYVPFGALPQPGARDQVSGKNKQIQFQPLILNHEILSLPSASALAVLRTELTGRKRGTKTLAVLADPVFQDDDPRIKRDSAKTGKPDDPSSSNSTGRPALDTPLERSARDIGEAEFLRLPHTRQEAEGIISFARRGMSRESLDFEANRATALSADLTNYRIIHFATHGFLNNQHPELSGLVLSLVDETGKPQDGFLRLYEIYNLELGADLVVLSACRTALGKEIKGEGRIGLTRGFMYAGAPRVVASLWAVDDEITAELMKRFYRDMLINGERPAAALRTAQVSIWKDKRLPPYYWAAFVLQGEWK